MSWASSILLALSVLDTVVLAAPTARSTTNVIDLRRTGTSPASSRFLRAARTSNSTRLISVEDGAGYAVPIQFGTQDFSVLFDTGSSDLWLPASNFQCVDENGQDATGQCGLDTRYQGTFTGGSIPNEHFNITYADGEFLVGTLGYEDVELGGVKVPNQEAALVTSGYFNGDGATNGLIGFAYPRLTSAFTGSDPAGDSDSENQAQYNPFFFNAVAQGLIDPVFTVILERGDPAGELTLGGVPEDVAQKTFATTKLETLQLGSRGPSNFSYYTIVPDSYTLVSEGTSTAQIPFIVDSGTTLTYFPAAFAEAINAAFDPPSLFIEEEGVFENYCDATPPEFSINIGGTEFSMSAEDLLLGNQQDSYTGGCLTGIQSSSQDEPSILGETFLRNVIAVFDVGNEEMRFTAQ